MKPHSAILSQMQLSTFDNFPYSRPNLEQFESLFRNALNFFISATSFSDCENAIDRINELRSEIDTMQSLAMIRYNVNTSDTFYAEEAHYFDTHLPIYNNLLLEYYKAINNSIFKDKIEEKWGKTLFKYIQCSLLSNHPSIIENLKAENQLASQYNKLIASAKIRFEQKEQNMADMQVYEQHPDRNVRKAAAEAKWNFFSTHAEKLDSLYDELVKNRHLTAQQLGYSNFIELAYTRHSRTDYKQEHVAIYRKQIKNFIVPLLQKIYAKKAKRLSLDSITYYDSALSFKSGNAKPKGGLEWILNTAESMFHELSPETEAFYKYMRNKNLMDLLSRKNKAFRGYCSWLSKYKSPFIFANFNGTANDVRVLAHELGHAFQKYHSKHLKLPEYTRPTLEACEIHSMGLEFLLWPWMNLFFEKDTIKYQYAHMCGALHLLAYGSAIDEFQHVVYAHPELSPQERKQEWKKIEKTYLPFYDYDNNEFLNDGGYWQQQSHVYTKPFYYIDYALAQICALQFWKRSRENFNAAWQDYMKICKVGGSLTFSEILQLANLKSPFEEDCLETTIQPVMEWLNSINDSDLE